MSASEPHLSDPEQCRSAGRTVLTVCAVLAAMVSVIVVARLFEGGPIALLSIALPLVGLGWLAGLGVKMWRLAPAGPVAPARDERPSRRAPRFEPSAGARSDRPSDSGGHVSA